MFTVMHMDANGDDDPPVETLPELYDELWSSGILDGSVAVIHEDTGWCMSAHRDRSLIFEHLGDGGERHMIPVKKNRVIELWKRLIAGDISGLLAEPWIMGYGEARNA